MKYKDYKRLAKISLKARKKTTRSTVRGISFGLILLMPLLFIVIAFHIDLNKEVDKDASIRVFDISYVNEISNNNGNGVYSVLDKYSEQVYQIKGVENIIKYNQYTLNNEKEAQNQNGNYYLASPFSVAIDDKQFSLNYYMNELDNEADGYKKENEVGIKIIDTSVGRSVFIKADSEVIGNKNPLMYGREFSNNSSKEIMVSSNFISHYNLNAVEIINKTITITYELKNGYDSVTSSKDSISGSDSLNAYSNVPVVLVKDFKIVGVFNSDIYKSSVRSSAQRDYYQENKIYETYFWLTTDSLYNSMGHSYLPESIQVEEDNGDGYVWYRSSYYYSDNPLNLSNNAKNNGNIFIPLGMGAKQKNDNDSTSLYRTMVEFESYGDANNAVEKINSLLELGAVGMEDPYISDNYMQKTFNNYRMFYNVFTYASIVLAIFGGVIFFATLLNLYNTIHYSVQSRRNYLGMIRAIGMKSSAVVKMYFIEVFQIFKRSYIWTAIFGGGICIGLSFAFDSIMNSSVGDIITIELSLNPIFILVAFIILVIINTIISIVFSLIACHSVSKKPILEVLVENR